MRDPHFSTLTEMLHFRSVEYPNQAAFSIEEKAVSYKELFQKVVQFAAFLHKKGLKKSDRVVIALPNGTEFFVAFYGVILAGGIAVPINHASGPERILSIARLSSAHNAIIPSSLLARLGDTLESGQKKIMSLLTIGHSVSCSPDVNFPEIAPSDVAFIQYTSGSTGNPKGVQLTHNNILTNIQQMIEGMRITRKDIFVSWLPAYHDMGLILMTMVPVYLGMRLHLMPTHIGSIRKWIETLDKQRATFTAAPDFGYRMALLYTRYPDQFNLRHLRVALNAAEPVRASTVEKFERTLGCRNCMMPAYGLAEATVGVSSWPPRIPIKVDDRGFVSVGKGFPDIEMKILADNQFAGPGTVGEILVNSPANSRGYFNNTRENACLFWRHKYIRTGDLGYYDNAGDFFIVGRKKNIIIHGGQNISPQEAEEVLDELPFVRLSAAVGVDRGHIDGEQVYVFAEIRRNQSKSGNALENLAIEITNTFQDRLGFRPGRVYLVKPHTIPRTTNGKVMHGRLKERYINGRLQDAGVVLFPTY